MEDIQLHSENIGRAATGRERTMRRELDTTRIEMQTMISEHAKERDSHIKAQSVMRKSLEVSCNSSFFSFFSSPILLAFRSSLSCFFFVLVSFPTSVADMSATMLAYFSFFLSTLSTLSHSLPLSPTLSPFLSTFSPLSLFLSRREEE